MTYQLVRLALETGMTPTERLVLVVLAAQANECAGGCSISTTRIARLTGYNERTVRRSLIELERAGHITRAQRAGTSTHYRVHPGWNDHPAPGADSTQDTAPAIGPGNIRDDGSASFTPGNERPPLSAFYLEPEMRPEERDVHP